MKTSGLTRFLAACLALISLSMLVSGILGLRSAAKEHRKDDAEIQDLQTKIDDYREISALLMDNESYSDLNDALKEQQEKYDSDISHHRTELATYSATNGGLQMGIEAMAQAKAALSAGKMQYETIVKLLEKLQPILDAIETLKGQVGVILEQLDVLRADLTMVPPALEALEQKMKAFETAGTNYLVVSAEEALQNLEEMIPSEGDNGDTDENGNPGSNPGETGDGDTGDQDPPENQENGVNSGSDEPGDAPVETGDRNTDTGDITGYTDPVPEEEEPLNRSEDGSDPQRGNGEDTPDDLPETADPESSAAIKSPATGEDKVTSLRNTAGDLLYEIESAESMFSDYGIIAEDLSALQRSLSQLNETLASLQIALNEMGVSPGSGLNDLLNTNLGASLEVAFGGLAGLDSSTYSLLADALLDGSTEEQIGDFKQGLRTVSEASATDLSKNTLLLQNLLAQSAGYRYAVQAAAEVADEIPLQILEIENRIYEMMNSMDSEEMSGGFGGLSLDSIDELGAQIEAGEQALAEGEAQLNATKEEQKKKAEELDREKRDLDQQEKNLKALTEQTEDQKDAEDREKGLRSALLSRNEIKRRTQYGADLLTASEAWLTEYTEQAENNYRDRFDSSILMMVCAILALAGAIASFGTQKNIAVTLLATVLCQAFAFSAAYLLYRMGRGISWSAVTTAVLSTGVMASLLPGLPVRLAQKKKAPQKTAWRKIED